MAVCTAYYDADLKLWRINHPGGQIGYVAEKPADAVEIAADGVAIPTGTGGVALEGTYVEPRALTTKDLRGAVSAGPEQVASQAQIDQHREKLVGESGAELDHPATPDLVDAAHQAPEGGQPTQDPGAAGK